MTHLTRRAVVLRGSLFGLGLAHLPTRILSRFSSRELVVANQPAKHRIVIEDLWPDRASYSPGAPATLHAAVRSEAVGQLQCEIRVSLLDGQISSEQQSISVSAGISEVQLPISLP